MNSPSTSEERALRDVLDSSMAHVHAPVDTEAQARAAGRRIRTRRRVGVVLATATVAAVGAVGLTTVLDTGGDRDDTAVAADQDAATTDRSPRPSTWWDMPGDVMTQTLADLLPEGVRLRNTDATDGSLDARLDTPAGSGSVSVELADAQPATSIVVDGDSRGLPENIDADDIEELRDRGLRVKEVQSGPAGAARYNCSPAWVRADSCTVIRNDAGEVIGRVLDHTAAGGVRALGVTLVAPDDGLVSIDVANTLDDKWPDGATPSSSAPPLTVAQLREIAQDSAWTTYQP